MIDLHREQDPEISAAWTAVAAAPAMTLVVGLERAMRPITVRAGAQELDRGAVLALDALVQTGARVVVVSSRARATIDRVRAALTGATWFADAGESRFDRGWTASRQSLEGWIRANAPEGPLVAIGDGLPIELVHPIGAFEVAVRLSPRDPRSLRRRLSGPGAVRAFLWWLTEVRRR